MLKAGRVGVAPKEVDAFGNIIGGGGGGTGYTKEEVDAKLLLKEDVSKIGGLEFRNNEGTAQYKVQGGDWTNFNSDGSLVISDIRRAPFFVQGDVSPSEDGNLVYSEGSTCIVGLIDLSAYVGKHFVCVMQSDTDKYIDRFRSGMCVRKPSIDEVFETIEGIYYPTVSLDRNNTSSTNASCSNIIEVTEDNPVYANYCVVRDTDGIILPHISGKILFID